MIWCKIFGHKWRLQSQFNVLVSADLTCEVLFKCKNCNKKTSEVGHAGEGPGSVVYFSYPSSRKR